MAVRTLEVGFGTSVKSYATPEKAGQVATEWANKISGLVNVKVVPHEVPSKTGGTRWTAVFSCFSEEGDIFLLARAACPFMIFR